MDESPFSWVAKPLKMQEAENRAFRRPLADKAQGWVCQQSAWLPGHSRAGRFDRAAPTAYNRAGSRRRSEMQQRRRFFWRTLGIGLALSLMLHAAFFLVATAVYAVLADPDPFADAIEIDLSDYTLEQLEEAAAAAREAEKRPEPPPNSP
jgi:hypothetical protein